MIDIILTAALAYLGIVLGWFILVAIVAAVIFLAVGIVIAKNEFQDYRKHKKVLDR